MLLRSLRSKVVVLVTLAAAPPLAFFGHVMVRDRRVVAEQSLISGYADGAASAKELMEGGHLLMKPLTPEALARKVRELLDA